jgi:hypothetical protein
MLVNYSLTLDVPGTAATNIRPTQNGERVVKLHLDKQLDSHARMLIVIYTINSMGYKNPMNSKATKATIAEAACTLVCYDLGYKRVMAKSRLDIWLQELEQSARIKGNKVGWKSRHQGKPGGMRIQQINNIDPTYLTKLYHYVCHRIIW